MTAKDNEGNKGEVTNITNDNLLSDLQTCVCVESVTVLLGSSARWVMSIAGMVES